MLTAEAVAVVLLFPHPARRQLVSSHIAQIAVSLARWQVFVLEPHQRQLLVQMTLGLDARASRHIRGIAAAAPRRAPGCAVAPGGWSWGRVRYRLTPGATPDHQTRWGTSPDTRAVSPMRRPAVERRTCGSLEYRSQYFYSRTNLQ